MRLLSFFARIITFYEELFDESGLLEGGFGRFSRALSRFMKSCLTRAVRLKTVSVVVFARIITFYKELFDEGASLESGFCRFSRALSRFMKSCLTRVVRLNTVSVVFRAHYHVLCKAV